MSRILHLSDVHLGDPEAHQWLDQHRGTLAAVDRRAQKHVLIETTDALAEAGVLQELDAVVVSGDLTNRAAEDGFAEFADLARKLTQFVPPEQVVVVPGNHDVPHKHGPGDPVRYEHFLKVTRELKFVTPLLDGIDFDEDGHLIGEPAVQEHLVQGDRFTILPINSSHFCWGVEPLPERVIEKLLSVDLGELSEATEQLRRYDIPRVSNAQITAIGEFLGGLDAAHRLSANGRVPIAVLHHQLLPVSSREEFKSFESLTNLGAVREFLVSIGIQVVLHGHKHESALYWDYVAHPEAFSAPPARMLVSAAPGRFLPGEVVARVLDVGQRRSATDVRIEGVISAGRRAGRIRCDVVGRARLWDSPSVASSSEARVVRGTTPSDVYARIQSLFDGVPEGQPLRYLVCEIEDASNAETIPADYARSGPPEAVQAWMTDLVDWWQLPDPRLGDGVAFNHGERIYKRWRNQVQRAARVLSEAVPGDPGTTRAAILLLDPWTDSSPAEGEFPSFVSVQLQLLKTASTWQIDCTGSFRKQEMRYWWPINVAELARVQRAVAEAVWIGESHPGCGLLRTVTAYAVAEERLPVVAVPAVDRAVDQRPGDLWRMAYSLLEPDKANGAEIRSVWQRYLDDLRPPDAIDKAPAISRRGLQRVLDSVAAVDPGGAQPGVATLREMIRVYKLVGNPQTSDREELRQTVTELLEALERELDDLFGGSTAAPEPAEGC
jgi:predicted phosphodiesterase